MIELLSGFVNQGIAEDVFSGTVGLARLIALPPPVGLSEKDPAGRFDFG